MQVSHGIISLFLICMAVATACGVEFSRSPVICLLYVCVVALSALILAYSYCAKCPCRRGGCGHVIFGRLTEIFPKRKEGPYTFIDILFTTISIAAVLLIPQIWLIESMPAFILFWALIVLAVLDIVFLVCPDCSNKNCVMNKKK